MVLLKEQIQEILKTPKSKDAKNKAVQHEQKLKFHIDTKMDISDARAEINNFLSFVRTLLPEDKFHVFNNLFRFPVATNELTEEIFNSLEKVYDGKDADREHHFISPEYLDDWKEYETRLKSDDFWRNDAWQHFKTGINGFIIVDLETEQNGSVPEPYFYYLSIEDALDFQTDKDGVLEWFMYKPTEDTLAVFCDLYYQLFNLNDKGEIIGEAEISNQHDLGYCPVSFFWKESLDSENIAVKKSPLSNQIGHLEWLLFFLISKKHLDLYAPYPIYSGYEQDCDFENKLTGDFCDGGFIRNSKNDYVVDRLDKVLKCPVCSDKRISGVGSFVEIPLPSRDNDFANLKDPVGMLTVDIESLKYNVDECDRLYDNIYTGVVGVGGDVGTNKAFNKDQVKANTESRRNVLLSIKKNLEHIESWTNKTICLLRYGKEKFLGNKIFYGSDWYLYSADEITEQYGKAKAAGASDYQLDKITDQIIEIENKYNPREKARAFILKDLEPYRHMTKTEVLDLLDRESIADNDLILIKINFANFVSRFERENINLVDFGVNLDYHTKIERILTQFKNYGREQTKGAGTKTGTNGGADPSTEE